MIKYNLTVASVALNLIAGFHSSEEFDRLAKKKNYIMY